MAFVSQLSVPRLHSLTFVQVTPFPVYPESHAQVNEPTVLVHAALLEQLSVLAVHSLTSEQVTPFPV